MRNRAWWAAGEALCGALVVNSASVRSKWPAVCLRVSLSAAQAAADVNPTCLTFFSVLLFKYFFQCM